MYEKGANNTGKEQVFSAWDNISYFQREYHKTILDYRGKTYRELGATWTALLLRFDCLHCADQKCKLRKHAFRKPLTKDDQFFTCSELKLLAPTEAEILRQRSLAEQSAKKAQDIRQKAVEEFRAGISEWLMKDEHALDYAEAASRLS